jgi:hypothetical protein
MAKTGTTAHQGEMGAGQSMEGGRGKKEFGEETKFQGKWGEWHGAI